MKLTELRLSSILISVAVTAFGRFAMLEMGLISVENLQREAMERLVGSYPTLYANLALSLWKNRSLLLQLLALTVR